jgi:hypothetical protein
MLERSSVTPALGGDDVTGEHVLAHLRQWRADTALTVEQLHALRQRVEDSQRQLENPRAAFEYIEFFTSLFDRVAADLDRLMAELPAGFTPQHGDLLRQIASNAAAEQRRTVMFRDKWVNKPLPFEQVRPLLTELASGVRDQLADYRELTLAASRLAELAPPPPTPDPEPKPDEREFDRRALFTKLIKPLGENEKS